MTNHRHVFTRSRRWGLICRLTPVVAPRFTPAGMRTAHKSWGGPALVLLWVLTILLGPGQPAVMASPLPSPAADGSPPLGSNLAANVNRIVAWGSSDDGRTTTPPDLLDVISVAAGYRHNLALKKDGTVVAWGANAYGALNVPVGLTNVIAIDAGENYNLVLKGDGTVVAWGNNTSGQSTVPAGLAKVRAIAAGGSHSLALKDDGTIVAWGDNYYGQSTVPAELRDVRAIAAGENHSLALKIDGTVVAWGRNQFGQSTVPAGLTNVQEIDAGKDHSLARTTRTVVAWGDNYWGQLNIPTGIDSVPIVDISAGGNHNLVLRGNRTVIAWGGNDSGQAIVPFAADSVLAIAAGENHNLAITLNLAIHPKDYPEFCLTLPNNAASNGASVNLATCIENNGQRWVQKSDETIRPQDHPNYCLTLPNNAASNGALVNLISCTAGNNAQKWMRNVDETIRPQDHPNYCLTLPNNTASEGALIKLAPCTAGSNAQKWPRSPLTPWLSALKTVSTLRPLDHQNFCLQAPIDIPVNKVVKLWQCDGSSYQQWVLFSDGSIRPAIRGWNNLWCLHGSHPLSIQNCNGLSGQKWFSDGYHTLRTQINPKHCLDLQNNQASNGAFVGILLCSNWRSQYWSVWPIRGGVAAAAVADTATLTATQPLSSTLPDQPASSVQNQQLFLPLVANDANAAVSANGIAATAAAVATSAVPTTTRPVTTMVTATTTQPPSPLAAVVPVTVVIPVTTTVPVTTLAVTTTAAVTTTQPVTSGAVDAAASAPPASDSSGQNQQLFLPIITNLANLAGRAVGGTGSAAALVVVGLIVIGGLVWQRRRPKR